MRKQIRIRKRGFVVLGASVLLAVAPLTSAGAILPTETKHSQGGCEAIDPQQNWSAAKVCRDLNDGAQVGTGVSTTQQPTELASSSDSYLESPILWVVAILAGAAGAFVAVIRRHRPAALS